MFVGRATSRRTFLVLGGLGFAGVVFSSVAGCGGEEEGSSGVTMTSEPAEKGGLRQTAEISTPRGTLRGGLYPVEGAREAVLMVGARAATSPPRRASITSWLPVCRSEARRASASNTARRTNSTSAFTTFSLVSKPSAGRRACP